MALIFQPPYSPELNPAEQIWAWYKREFTNKVFDSIPKVVDFITEKTKQLSANMVKSIARYEYIFLDYWTIN
jgi:transposase